MVRPVVHSIKHYVQFSLATVTGGAVVTDVPVVAVQRADLDTLSEITEGSIIKAIYIEMWIRSSSTTPTSGQMIIYKSEGDTTSPTATDMAALGSWENKKNIFYTTMGLFNDQDADATMAFKGWIKIPKGKQRFGLNDKLKISIFAATVDAVRCGFATYKEYS